MNRRAQTFQAISRRSLIGTGAAAALVAASSLGARAEPKRGGTLRLAAPGPADLTSHAPGLFGRLLAPGSVFDCLTEIGPDGRLAGELATDWAARGDAATWVITLRADVSFHDGRGFGAEDAIASLRSHGKALGIEGMRKLGPHQIQVSLRSPDPGFPFALSDPGVVMLPGDEPHLALRDGIGTGLYRTMDATDDRVHLARVHSHWKDGVGGWFDTVELLREDDPETRLNLLLSGRTDGVGELDWMALDALRGRYRGMSLRSTRRLEIAAKGPNAKALADALKLGIDRQGILDRVLNGHGRIGADTPIPGGRPQPHDPVRARQGLARAGVDRATLALGDGMTGFPGLSRLVSEIRRAADAMGLSLAASDTAPDLTIRLGLPAPTEDLALRRYSKDGISDPAALEQLLEQSRIVSKTSAKREIHAVIAQELADHGQTVVPVFADHAFAFTNRLTHNRHIGALDTLDSARMAERWFYGSYG